MDDIDSYYTERPAYPRPPPPGIRSYPPPHMMQNRPPYGRPQGPPRMGPPGPPRMGPGPMGGPMGRPMGRPMGPPMGQGPPRLQGGRPMGPGPMNGRPMPPRQGPPPMGALPRRPESPAGRPPMSAYPRPESPFREPPSMGALSRRPESPAGRPPMGGFPRPESPSRFGQPAGPPPTGALPRRPESPAGLVKRAESPLGATLDMVPAPLNLRRSPPPQESLEPPQRRPSPPMNSPKPLDIIGAPRMRSPSPNPNAMVRPLDSIGAPRPPRSSSARPAETRSPNLLAPEWENHSRARSASADDYLRREEFVSAPLAPLRTASPETLGADAYQPVSPKTMQPVQAPTNFGNPVQAHQRQHQPKSDDIVLGADFFEEITVGPYQDLDHPPPLPRKNSVKPSMVSQILAPQRLPSPAPQRLPSPAPPPKHALPPTPEDESPLPANRGLQSMWLGEFQAGPYAQSGSPPMPSRSLSRSPPLDTPDMSASPSDSEDNFNDTALPPLFAGLRIQTGSEQAHTLASTTYNPHDSSSSDVSAFPATPDNRDSYATDICETEIQIDESSPVADNGDLPAKTPRKHIPSMCEYMSMDQLEDMWGKEDQIGATGYFSFDPTPAVMADDGPSGTPF